MSTVKRWFRAARRSPSLAALLMLSGAPAIAGGDSAAPHVRDEPCDIPVLDDAVAARLRCARLVVPRDPARPEDGSFELAVVIRRSAAPEPRATPILLLHGGPGGEMTRYMGRSARDIAPGHDLVAFDMRGSGRSLPRVCRGSSVALMRTMLHPDGLDAGMRERGRILDACRSEWRDAGFTAAHFGTARNVADAEALRAALGVARWRILAESYGTTVAAHYLAQHPGSIEAAVLDSLYPADDQVLPAAEMQGRLLDRLGAECRRDAACAARWPDLGRGSLDATVAALDATPLQVGSGAAARRLDGLGLRQLLMVAAGTEAGVRGLPFLLDAAARRDVTLLARPLSLITAAGAGEVEGGNLAALFATDCRDRARHHDNHDLSDPIALLVGLPGSHCRAWAEATEAPRWPVQTAVPVLLLAGGYDSFQPDPAPVLAAMGASARLVEVPHAAHVARGAGPCVRDIAGAFLAEPAQAPDTRCIATMPVPPFLLDAVALRGPASLATGSPPAALLIAAGALSLGLLATLYGWWRRRGGTPAQDGQQRLWTWLAVAAGLATTAALAAVVSRHPPEQTAVLLYGVPSSWAWLPWLALTPALTGVLALWRGPQQTAARLAAAGVLTAGTALVVGGWTPLG